MLLSDCLSIRGPGNPPDAYDGQLCVHSLRDDPGTKHATMTRPELGMQSHVEAIFSRCCLLAARKFETTPFVYTTHTTDAHDEVTQAHTQANGACHALGLPTPCKARPRCGQNIEDRDDRRGLHRETRLMDDAKVIIMSNISIEPAIRFRPS